MAADLTVADDMLDAVCEHFDGLGWVSDEVRALKSVDVMCSTQVIGPFL